MNELGGDGISWKSHSKGNISIGNDVWIGFKVTILSGVTIGNGAVIGSNSLISSDIPPFAVVAGNPSRVLKYRFRSEIRDLMEQLSWWDLENDQIKEITTQLFFEVPTIEKLLELIKKFKK
jgi:serine acetyltransferase